jgi:Mg2+/Co2+ transporter CorB
VYSPGGARESQVVRCILERQDRVISTLLLRMCDIGICIIIYNMELWSIFLSRLRGGVGVALLFIVLALTSK